MSRIRHLGYIGVWSVVLVPSGLAALSLAGVSSTRAPPGTNLVMTLAAFPAILFLGHHITALRGDDDE